MVTINFFLMLILFLHKSFVDIHHDASTKIKKGEILNYWKMILNFIWEIFIIFLSFSIFSQWHSKGFCSRNSHNVFFSYVLSHHSKFCTYWTKNVFLVIKLVMYLNMDLIQYCDVHHSYQHMVMFSITCIPSMYSGSSPPEVLESIFGPMLGWLHYLHVEISCDISM